MRSSSLVVVKQMHPNTPKHGSLFRAIKGNYGLLGNFGVGCSARQRICWYKCWSRPLENGACVHTSGAMYPRMPTAVLAMESSAALLLKPKPPILSVGWNTLRAGQDSRVKSGDCPHTITWTSGFPFSICT